MQNSSPLKVAIRKETLRSSHSWLIAIFHVLVINENMLPDISKRMKHWNAGLMVRLKRSQQFCCSLYPWFSNATPSPD